MSGQHVPLSLREGFLEDYDALRNGAGGVPCTRDVLRVHGPDALEYMQGQCTQDLLPLAIGGSADALLLEPQGKLDALVRVTKTSDDDLLVDVDGGYGELVRTRLERFKLRIKAQIEVVPWKCVAVRGRRLAEGSETVAGPHDGGPRDGGPRDSTDIGKGLLALPYYWNGVEGVDLFGEDVAVPDGVRECGSDALDAVRIEAGIPEMGSELDERTIPAEAHLLERCVSFTKGCYTGQELVARLEARGNRVARNLSGLVLDVAALSAGMISSLVGSDVVSGEKVVGSVTSAAWSPSLDAVVGLGYVHRSLTAPAEVQIRAPRPASDPSSGPVLVQAEVRELPLVPLV